MKLLSWLVRLLGIILLAAVVSGAWLYRHELLQRFRPGAEKGRGASAGSPSSTALARARDKIDSLHGWSLDSVVLSPAEAASLLLEGLPSESRRHLDSVSVLFGTGRITVSAMLESAAIPREQLGPLAGALHPWERITADGPVGVPRPGQAVWQVEALTIRGFTLPEAASRSLIGKALRAADDGSIALTLPRGVAGLHIRPSGVALFREEMR
jgi:hypothetical protein